MVASVARSFVALALALSVLACARAERHSAPPVLIAPAMASTDREPITPTLTGLLRAADNHNTRIALARAAVEAAQGARRTAREYPNPELELEQGGVPAERLDPSEGAGTVAIEQPVVIGGRVRRGSDLGAARVQEARALLEVTRREEFLRIHLKALEAEYYGLLATLRRDQIERLDEFVTVAASFEERLDTERQELALQAPREMSSAIYARLELAEMIGVHLPASEPLSVPLEEEAAFSTLQFDQEHALESHPALTRAQWRVEAARRAVALARAEAIPDVRPRLEASQDWDTDETTVGVGIVIPIPAWSRNQGAVARAQAELAQAESEAVGDRRRLARELRESTLRITEYDTIATEYRDRVLPGAAAAWDSALTRFANGEADFAQAFEALTNLQRAEATLLRARYELSTAVATLQCYRADYPEALDSPAASGRSSR